MLRILIVDDDKNIRRYYKVILSHAGYYPFLASSAKEAMKIIESQKINLIILDAIMPNIDGFTFTQTLRDYNIDIPILMISSKQLSTDIKRGFMAGVDDYMVKPVDEEEMLLRIKALLRRAKIASEDNLIIGNTSLNYNTLTVSSHNHQELLPQKEFYLLYKLLSYPNQIFTRFQLMEDIWGPASASSEATVSVHINRIRKRYKNNPDFSIQTIRGLGYKAYIKNTAG